MARFREKSGNALMWVLCLFAVSTVLIGGLMTLVTVATNTTAMQKHQQQAYFTARSAVLAEISNIQKDPAATYNTLKTNKVTQGNATMLGTGSDPSLGDYRVFVTQDPNDDLRMTVTATAVYHQQSSTVTAHLLKNLKDPSRKPVYPFDYLFYICNPGQLTTANLLYSDGNTYVDGNLTYDGFGLSQGNNASNVIANGNATFQNLAKVKQNVHASGNVKIQSGASVYGKTYYGGNFDYYSLLGIHLSSTSYNNDPLVVGSCTSETNSDFMNQYEPVGYWPLVLPDPSLKNTHVVVNNNQITSSGYIDQSSFSTVTGNITIDASSNDIFLLVKDNTSISLSGINIYVNYLDSNPHNVVIYLGNGSVFSYNGDKGGLAYAQCRIGRPGSDNADEQDNLYFVSGSYATLKITDALLFATVYLPYGRFETHGIGYLGHLLSSFLDDTYIFRGSLVCKEMDLSDANALYKYYSPDSSSLVKLGDISKRENTTWGDFTYTIESWS